MKLSKNFSLSEFACKDKNRTPVPADKICNVTVLALNLQMLRNAVGKSISIVSGYRTPAHNKSVGGKSHSEHLNAKAADIQIPGMTPKQVYNKILELIKSGDMQDGGLSLYPTFIHYDTGKPRRWEN